jgi:cell division protein FtsL
MKGVASVSKENSFAYGMGWMFKILLVATLIFFIVVVKYKYINIGYEISRLSSEVDSKELEYQKLLEEKMSVTESHRLYKTAESMGLKLPDHNRVFYVE